MGTISTPSRAPISPMSGAPVFTSGDQVSRSCPPGDALSSHVSGSWGAGFGSLSSWVSGDYDNLKGSSWPAANPGNCTEPEIYTSLSEKEAPVHPAALAWRAGSWFGASLLGVPGGAPGLGCHLCSLQNGVRLMLWLLWPLPGVTSAFLWSGWPAGLCLWGGGARTVSHLEGGIKNLAPQGSAGGHRRRSCLLVNEAYYLIATPAACVAFRM